MRVRVPDYVRLRRVPFLIPTWAAAQTWDRVILVRRDVTLTPELLAHELVHVEQWRRYGLVGFPLRYLWQTIAYGYRYNRFEVEARAAAGH